MSPPCTICFLLVISSLALTASAVEQESIATCPPIDYKQDFSCSGGVCIISFLNLSSRPINGVSARVSSSSRSRGGQSQQSFRRPMRFAGGMMTRQQRRWSRALGLGSSSAFAQSLLNNYDAAQVFQMVVPSPMFRGRFVTVSFTYVTPGHRPRICATEVFPLVHPHIYPSDSDMDTGAASLQSEVDQFDSLLPTATVTSLVDCHADCLKRCPITRRKHACESRCRAQRCLLVETDYYLPTSSDRLVESMEVDILDEASQ